MFARVTTVAFEGIEARPIDVQVQIGPGMPHFTIVGLPDKAVAESRVSGPLLDRIDLQIEVPAVSAADLVLPAASEGSAEVRACVAGARAIQAERFAALKHPRARTNADCDGSLLEDIAAPDHAGRTLLREAADALGLSARGYHRTLRVARTLADLDGEARVARIHIAEALSYRGETLRRAQAAA